MAFAVLFISAAAQAASAPADSFDGNVYVSAEEYPLGGLVNANLGYGKKLWASPEDPDVSEGSFWKYGYIRPAVEWKTSAVTNRITGYVDFYPISIFGISVAEVSIFATTITLAASTVQNSCATKPCILNLRKPSLSLARVNLPRS